MVDIYSNKGHPRGARTLYGKKGQMKIQQMAFMLIALTILFALVALFAAGTTLGGLKEKSADIREDNAIRLVSTIANSPEFSCGSAYGKDRINCVDLDKALALKFQIDNYKGFWGVDEITIIKTYKESSIECEIGNSEECGILYILQGDGTGNDHFSYISLCNKVKGEFRLYDKCEIAKLIVRFGDEK